MLSRVADSIYWMNRYIERIENYARFINVNLYLGIELPYHFQEQWRPVIITTGDIVSYEKYYDDYKRDHAIQFLTFDTNNSNAIISSLNMARENAKSIREIISTEMWNHLNEFYHWVKDSVSQFNWNLESLLSFYAEVKRYCLLFYGITNSTMSRTEGWHFGNAGRYLERADKTARILDVKYFILLPSPEDIGSPLDVLLWSSVLKSASAYEMYFKVYSTINAHDICEFLILNKEFPRSILYSLVQVGNSLRMITGSRENTFSNPSEKKIGLLNARLNYTEIDDVIDFGLHEFLDQIEGEIIKVGSAINTSFFTYENLIWKGNKHELLLGDQS